jgi:2,3-bisphosphoglycerate-dependent phosphoglycerate mutase
VQETVKKHGADQVQIWRRSFDIPPPDIDESSEFNPAKELVVENVELTSARSIFSSKSSEMRLHL